MEEEISAQPELLSNNLELMRQQCRAIDLSAPEAILLVARGSSDNAALYARYLFEILLGIPVFLAAPSVLTRYHAEPRYPKCLAIGISQSGAAPDVSEFVSYMREHGHATVAITNTPGSLLAREASHVIDLNVGAERSVAATKTYSASLLALALICERLGGERVTLDMLPKETWMTESRSAAEDALAKIDLLAPIFMLGRGYSFATAAEAALKLMECALVPARAYSSADFQHGPKALAGPNSVLIGFCPVSEELRLQGAQVVEAGIPPVPEFIQPLWQIAFAQWLALSAARLKGLDPDQPQFIQKVTETR
jgi:glucosamine--fructose-6-phosphate aminotransferase (isomerizing)